MALQKNSWFYRFLTALAWSKALREGLPYRASNSPAQKILAFLSPTRGPLPVEEIPKEKRVLSLYQRLPMEVKHFRPSHEAILREIVSIDPDNARAYNRLGILLAKQNRVPEAIQQFEKFVRLEPKLAMGFHNLALAYYELKEYQKAKDNFQEALSLDANDARRHVAYAKAQEALGDEKAMIESLKKAVEVERSARTLRTLYMAYSRYGMDAEAGIVLRELRHKGTLLKQSTKALKLHESDFDYVGQAIDMELACQGA